MREQLKEIVRPGQRRVALVTYSTKPRGGVVHTLSLADAMVDQAMDVSIVALGNPDQGFFRPVRAPYVAGSSVSTGRHLGAASVRIDR